MLSSYPGSVLDSLHTLCFTTLNMSKAVVGCYQRLGNRLYFHFVGCQTKVQTLRAKVLVNEVVARAKDAPQVN